MPTVHVLKENTPERSLSLAGAPLPIDRRSAS